MIENPIEDAQEKIEEIGFNAVVQLDDIASLVLERLYQEITRKHRPTIDLYRVQCGAIAISHDLLLAGKDFRLPQARLLPQGRKLDLKRVKREAGPRPRISAWRFGSEGWAQMLLDEKRKGFC